MHKLFLEITYAVKERKTYQFFYQGIPMTVFFEPKNNSYLLQTTLSALKEKFPYRSKNFPIDRHCYLSFENSKVSYTRVLPNLHRYLAFRETFGRFLEEISFY